MVDLATFAICIALTVIITLTASHIRTHLRSTSRRARQPRQRFEQIESRSEKHSNPIATMSQPTQASLTSRELQIAQLAAHGLSNKEIALRLNISTNTVNNHLKRIFTKLGIRSRTQLRAQLTSTDVFSDG